MKPFFICLLMMTLVATGCRRHEEPAPSTPPTPPPAKTGATVKPAPAAVPAPNATTKPPGLTHPTPAPMPEVTFTNLEQYVAMNQDQRLAAVSTVGNQGSEASTAPRSAKKLGEMFRVESSVPVKTAILDELGFLESPAALDPVLATFDSTQPDEVRESAIDAAETLLTDIASSDNPNALNIIVRALDARYPQEVREAGISALEDLQDQHAVPHLQKLLTDSNEDIRQRASDAIDWLKE